VRGSAFESGLPLVLPPGSRRSHERVEKRFDLKPKRLVGDTAYGAAPMLNWIVKDKQIEPHIPVREKSQRDDGTFSRSDLLRAQAALLPEQNASCAGS
jgi:hypothetical protein